MNLKLAFCYIGTFEREFYLAVDPDKVEEIEELMNDEYEEWGDSDDIDVFQTPCEVYIFNQIVEKYGVPIKAYSREDEYDNVPLNEGEFDWGTPYDSVNNELNNSVAHSHIFEFVDMDDGNIDIKYLYVCSDEKDVDGNILDDCMDINEAAAFTREKLGLKSYIFNDIHEVYKCYEDRKEELKAAILKAGLDFLRPNILNDLMNTLNENKSLQFNSIKDRVKHASTTLKDLDNATLDKDIRDKQIER